MIGFSMHGTLRKIALRWRLLVALSIATAALMPMLSMRG